MCAQREDDFPAAALVLLREHEDYRKSFSALTPLSHSFQSKKTSNKGIDTSSSCYQSVSVHEKALRVERCQTLMMEVPPTEGVVGRIPN